MLYRAVECFERLAGERAPAPVGDRRGNNQRQGIAELLQGIYGGLGIEGIEAGLENDEVGPSSHEGVDLLPVSLCEIIEIIGSECRIGCVRRQRERLACRPDAAGDIDPAVGRVGYEARPSGRLVRQLRSLAGLAFVGQRNAVGVETVGRDDVRTGVDVSAEGLLLAQPLLEHGSHGSVEDQDAAGYILEDAHQKCLRMISTVLSGLPIV